MAVEEAEEDSGPKLDGLGAGGASGRSGCPLMVGGGVVVYGRMWYVVECRGGGLAPSPLAIGAVMDESGDCGCRHEDSGAVAVAYARGSIRSSEQAWSQVGVGDGGCRGCRGAERCNAQGRVVIGLPGRMMGE